MAPTHPHNGGGDSGGRGWALKYTDRNVVLLRNTTNRQLLLLFCYRTCIKTLFKIVKNESFNLEKIAFNHKKLLA